MEADIKHKEIRTNIWGGKETNMQRVSSFTLQINSVKKSKNYDHRFWPMKIRRKGRNNNSESSMKKWWKRIRRNKIQE